MRPISLLCLLALGACGSLSEPEGPGITGSIVARDLDIPIGGPPTIHVKFNANDQCGIIFLIRDRTSVFRRMNGSLVSAPVAELTVGRQVVVWSGLSLDSCPGQGRADAVEIL